MLCISHLSGTEPQMTVVPKIDLLLVGWHPRFEAESVWGLRKGSSPRRLEKTVGEHLRIPTHSAALPNRYLVRKRCPSVDCDTTGAVISMQGSSTTWRSFHFGEARKSLLRVL